MNRQEAIARFGIDRVRQIEAQAIDRQRGHEAVDGDVYAPVKRVEETTTVKVPQTTTDVKHVRVEHTKWFNAETQEPGQPGVFEVDRVVQFDGEPVGPRRFSYFNGRKFGPISTTPEQAFLERFNFSVLSASIKKFRGLSEG